MTVHYSITLHPEQHLYEVQLNFIAMVDKPQVYLPVWIPGSYMIREFSKNITEIHAAQSCNKLIIEQINKNNWLISDACVGQEVSINYFVYAYEYGIRTAFLDHTRGYFNPTSLCLAVKDHEINEHTVNINNLPNHWSAVSGLPINNDNVFMAANYDELLDMPFELGNIKRLEFEVAGIPHYLVLSGIIPEFDKTRIINDMQKVCEYQINLFGGVAPYTNYTFILNLSGEVYTGLEHRNSTLLMAPFYALPNQNQSNEDDYIKLMGLISHEFFHTWNVKRIKPKVFTPYNLQEENYTKLLWWFEGVTSYYDDLVLYRTGIINQDKYLNMIVENLNNVYKFAGVTKQSVANSSLTSWVKYYRQDENSPNSIVSYYVKGSLIALCLDLLIRANSKFSLDSVMLYLYKEWEANQTGIAEGEFANIIRHVTGVDVSDFIIKATETTDMLPYQDVFAIFGLDLRTGFAKNHQQSSKFNIADNLTSNYGDLGMKLEKHSLGYIVKNVYNDTSASKAGIAANDLLIALNNVKLTNVDKQLGFVKIGDKFTLSLFRQERLVNIDILLEPSSVNIFNLYLDNINKLTKWL